MNLLARGLDERDDRARELHEADQRWMLERLGIDPAERLASWDRWVRGVLAKTLVWPTRADARERLLNQCAVEITVLAKQLRGRGWLLDGEALAAHIRALLEPIGKAQAAGKVGDFWPYFRASVARYVGANAEEIQRQAKRIGADEAAQSIGSILGGLTVLKAASMTELLATRAAEISQAKQESLREKQARLRAQDRARKADAQQPQLF